MAIMTNIILALATCPSFPNALGMLRLINPHNTLYVYKEGTVVNPILQVRQTEAQRVTFLRYHHWEGMEPEFEPRQPTPPSLYLADTPHFSQKACGMGEHPAAV